MIKIIHKFILSRQFDPVLHTVAVEPAAIHRHFNVNKIAESIEKANAVLIGLHSGATGRYNADAIATWERIIASLRHQWNDAAVEIATNGHYTFE